MTSLPFRNRREAGSQLAGALEEYGQQKNVVVLALPRGGVPVAAEVARALAAPLDVLVVRKVGAPTQPEFAIGAIATVAGNIEDYVNDDLLDRLGGGEAFAEIAARELVELRRREALYRADLDPLDLRGHTVLLVDDGLATGATMRAAILAVRNLEPARLVVAVPVASRTACEDLRQLVDHVVCLSTPEPFESVGIWYADFTQTTDDEVRRALHGT